jgi:RIO kinase 1
VVGWRAHSRCARTFTIENSPLTEDHAAKPREASRGANAAGGPRQRRQQAANSPPQLEPALSELPIEFAAGVQVTNTERLWLREHLGPFYRNQLIEDVVRRVKAGKEATVYACAGHVSTGRSVIAAKLYRERSLRSSKNTGAYQQGRALLDEEGTAVRPRAGRLHQPASHSKRSQALIQVSWLMHEYTLLKTLHAAGADVPMVIEHGEHALLMEFVGDGFDAAPTLNDVELTSVEATQFYERVLFNVELLLDLGWVHGDLSPYNILYQPDRIVLIDFPQVVDCQNNPRALAMLERDLERVGEYFERFGCKSDPHLAEQLWSKHIGDQQAD